MVQGKEKTMSDKREIIVLLRKGYSIRKIGRELGVHYSGSLRQDKKRATLN